MEHLVNPLSCLHKGAVLRDNLDNYPRAPAPSLLSSSLGTALPK
jgi:hypothetical protein